MLAVVAQSASMPASPDVAAGSVGQASGQAVTVGGSSVDEIVRDGARRMLAAALDAEAAAYIDAHVGQLDEHGHRLVVHNGHAVPRQVLAAAGAVEVRAPRVNDKRVDEATGSAHPGARKALAEIGNTEDSDHARRAIAAFKLAYGAKFTKAVAKLTDDLDELLAFYDFPAEHWVHLRTTNPIESTFATVRNSEVPGRG